MPPRGRNKLKSITGQPSVLFLVSETATNHTPTNKGKQLKKARTPPTSPNPLASNSNPEKCLNMSEPTKKEEDILGDLTPELRKIDLLIKRNLKQQLEPINNNINSLLKTAKITERKELEINTLKKENYLLKHKCQKLEREQKHIKERLDKMENNQLNNREGPRTAGNYFEAL